MRTAVLFRTTDKKEIKNSYIGLEKAAEIR